MRQKKQGRCHPYITWHVAATNGQSVTFYFNGRNGCGSRRPRRFSWL